MIRPWLRRPLDAPPRRRINREPLPLLAIGLPWASVMLASMVSFSPLIASAPLAPPLAFMLLLAWRVLRPGMLPVWAGAPLGLFDDLYSGQPLGSGVLLWSAALIAMEVIDARFRWRGFWQDWAVAAALIAIYGVLMAIVANLAGGAAPLAVALPPALLGMLLYPLVTGLVAALDRLRLSPIRAIRR